jgi:hypothetical protein
VRTALIVTLMSLGAIHSASAELREPLEKQFFDYFAAQCSAGLAAEAKSLNKDPSQPGLAEGINKYCACTAQAIVSYLDAGEIIAFANDATQEPAAGKMRPYFEKCSGK